MGEVVQLRDYQTLDERLNRWCREVDRVVREQMAEKAPYGGAGIDGMVFTAPDSDPA